MPKMHENNTSTTVGHTGCVQLLNLESVVTYRYLRGQYCELRTRLRMHQRNRASCLLLQKNLKKTSSYTLIFHL